MNRFVFVLLPTLAAGIAMMTPASAVVLQPNEADSKDTFVYQNLPAFNFDGGMFGSFLPVGKTAAPVPGHDTESLLEFDLSSVTLSAAQVTSATLELHAVDTTATGFGGNPDASHVVAVNLFGIAPTDMHTPWMESTVNWSEVAALTLAGQYASTDITGIDQAFTFDVSTLVKQWLDGTLDNNGMLLIAESAVPVDETFVVATFSSAAGGFAPKLTIVPEPSSVVLALSALAAVAWLSRRRAMGRNRMK
jgi:PEP-CTERM motif